MTKPAACPPVLDRTDPRGASYRGTSPVIGWVAFVVVVVVGAVGTVGAAGCTGTDSRAAGRAAHQSAAIVDRPDWGRHFAEAGVVGTIVVVDERPGGRAMVHNPERARTRYTPASTYKLPHALFAMDAGVVADPEQVFRWDGIERTIPTWNQDHTVGLAIRTSAVWVFQTIAQELGLERARSALREIDYGSAETSEAIDRYWLDGSLTISANEQIPFLRDLHGERLPFDADHQRAVKDAMIVASGSDATLRGKTGWASGEDPSVGWWVGWAEWPDGPVFFALNIDMPRGRADLAARRSIADAVLRELDALPD